jgi:hypothetical protein
LNNQMAGRRIAHPRDRNEQPMYARLVSFSGADPEKRERMIRTMRETVVPMLRQYDGFAGYIALYDQGNRRAKAVLLWRARRRPRPPGRNSWNAVANWPAGSVSPSSRKISTRPLSSIWRRFESKVLPAGALRSRS